MKASQDLTTFLDQFATRDFKKGEVIFHHGDAPTHAYVVKTGIVKNYTIDKAGVERPVVFDTRLEMFPISWIFGFTETCIYYYEAFTDCTIWVVPKDELHNLAKTNITALQELYNRLMKRQLDTQLRVEALEQSRANDKIVYTLRFLCSRFGKPLSDDKVQVMLAMTQQDFANFVGLTRETTAIELKQLAESGAIQYRRSHYTVYMDKIQDIIDSLE